MYKDFSLYKLMRLNELLAFAVRMEVLIKKKENKKQIHTDNFGGDNPKTLIEVFYHISVTLCL